MVARRFDVLFVQPSTNLISPDNKALDYYRQVYDKVDGFHIPSEHYMEIPLWIAMLTGKLYQHRCSLHVCDDVNYTSTFIRTYYTGADGVVMMSVLDVNKHIVRELVENCADAWFILGGYIDPSYFGGLKNVTWLNSIDELERLMPYYADAPPNYSLFAGQRTIPRLTLSRGCLHRCKFCTVETNLVLENTTSVSDQVMALKGLEFELVYLNDKTFGQAENWSLLRSVYATIRDFNPQFKGFVVQTTVPYALKYAQTWYENYHVRALEVGVEVPDDEFLAKMNKPYRMARLDDLMERLPVGMLFIPNLIFGMPHDDYLATENWYLNHQKDITFVNPYVLSYYDNAKGDIIADGQERDEEDSNENVLDRTWLTPIERRLAEKVMDKILGQVVRNLRPKLTHVPSTMTY